MSNDKIIPVSNPSVRVAVNAKCDKCEYRFVTTVPHGTDIHHLPCPSCSRGFGRPVTTEELLQEFAQQRDIEIQEIPRLLVEYEKGFEQLWAYLVGVEVGVYGEHQLGEVRGEIGRIIASVTGVDYDEWMTESKQVALKHLKEAGIDV